MLQLLRAGVPEAGLAAAQAELLRLPRVQGWRGRQPRRGRQVRHVCYTCTVSQLVTRCHVMECGARDEWLRLSEQMTCGDTHSDIVWIPSWCIMAQLAFPFPHYYLCCMMRCLISARCSPSLILQNTKPRERYFKAFTLTWPMANS